VKLPAPVEAAARAALAKKAEEVVALDLRSSTDFTDFFLLLSGQNQRQLVAIADAGLDTLDRSGSSSTTRASSCTS
jgi:ribosome-associated protein